MSDESLKMRAIALRKKGYSFSEIQTCLKADIPKSTLSHWCKTIVLSESAVKRWKVVRDFGLNRARSAAMHANAERRLEWTEATKTKYRHLSGLLLKEDIAKIALALLYAGEGSKKIDRASVTFGNSDPHIITLFLRLLRQCYILDEKKFRCTVQGRSDHNMAALEKFWASLTGIPADQFYASRVDERTRGKPSRKKNYCGVCRIDYFSAEIFRELMLIGALL